MTRLLVVVLLLFATATNSAALITRELPSEILNETRRIHVQLPAGYAESPDRYPLLIVLDGANLIRPKYGRQTLEEVLEELNAAGEIPPLITIGVLNTDRRRDMTPTHVPRRPTSGGADQFVRFLSEELLPFVDKEYRTDEQRVLFGHSLAGLLATHVLLARPELFDGVIASSPALSWDEDFELIRAPAILRSHDWEPGRFYFAIGEDDSYGEFIRACGEFEALLAEQSPERLVWRFELLSGEDHMSALPLNLRAGLRFFYDAEPAR